MKVKELIEKLKKLNPEDLVVLSIDGEGNAYNSLYTLGSGWYGEGQFYNSLEEANEYGPGDKKVIASIALWPEG